MREKIYFIEKITRDDLDNIESFDIIKVFKNESEALAFLKEKKAECRFDKNTEIVWEDKEIT